MQNIVPHLWFDTQAKEAAEFYTSLLPNSKINHHTILKGTPSGDCDCMYFTLMGKEFMSISAGPYFKLNPSISFMVNFDPSQDAEAETRIDQVWKELVEGGEVLMPLDAYPFSKRYGWVQDKYGVSWQLILTDPEGEERPAIIPSLLFVGENCGKAEEAIKFYAEVFKNRPHAKDETKVGMTAYYPAGMEPNKEGHVMFSEVQLAGEWLTAMDSGLPHDFQFNEAVSLLVRCDTQEEIDYLWTQLSAHPESEQCGWLKDKYGVSWQITPRLMDEVMTKGTQEQIDRVTQAFLPMKKLEIAPLQKAYENPKL